MALKSLVAACGLRCSAACGILVPQPGIEPISLALQSEFLTTAPPSDTDLCGLQRLVKYLLSGPSQKKLISSLIKIEPVASCPGEGVSVSGGQVVVAHSCLCVTLCDPLDFSLPGTSVHGILQASGLPFPSPGDLPNPGIKPVSPVPSALQADSLPFEL